MSSDIVIKRATYIQKNCEILQEFFFAHPQTKLRINNTYNCHFTGSPFWDLFGQDALKLEKTWNVSVRQMFSLPRESHRYLIEPVSENLHLKKLLLLRFMSFLRQIKSSAKSVPKDLLRVIENDTRSTTGNNIRNILRLTQRVKIEDVSKHDIQNICYCPIPNNEEWRIPFIKEIIEARNSSVEVVGFTSDELSDILEYLCSN